MIEGVDLYVLAEDGRTPVHMAGGLYEWARWFANADRHVAVDNFPDDVRVSTVFLGIDHSLWGGPPLLFETMIFTGPHDGYQERCSTWEEAEAQHAKAVALVEGKITLAERGRR